MDLLFEKRFNKPYDKDKFNKEIALQVISSNYGFSPFILDHGETTEYAYIKMEKLDGYDLAYEYGDRERDIPKKVWDKIRIIVKTLYEDEGIMYVDITPYNFVEVDGEIFIIDFGDAYMYSETEDNLYTCSCHNKNNCKNEYFEDFLNGLNQWNPDFA